MVLALAAGCATTGREPEPSPRTDARALADIDEAWFRRTIASDALRQYLAIPAGSIGLRTIDPAKLSRLAMTESFLAHPSWTRIWYVASLAPDEFTGIALLNYLAALQPDFVASDLARIGQHGDTRGFEAAVFAHIDDEPSRPPTWWTLIGLAGYHRDALLECAEFLAHRTQPYMHGEWKRLAGFQRNENIRAFARRCLEAADSWWARGRQGLVLRAPGADEFSQAVERARAFHRRFAGRELFGVSTHEILGERFEVREFEIRFLGRLEPAWHILFSMVGLDAKTVEEAGTGFVRFLLGPWPHRVTLASGAPYLDQIAELFALLERGETGEVRREYRTFLVVRAERVTDAAMRELQDALPEFTRLALVAKKDLLVLSVLNENLDAARGVLRSHLRR